MQVNSY